MTPNHKSIENSKLFKAKLKALEGSLGWKVVDIPFDVKKAFGRGGRLPVKGTVNGFGFRTSLFPRKDGPHFLLINKQMQKGAGGVRLGDSIEVVIAQDLSERVVTSPASLLQIFRDEPDLKKYYEGLNYSTQKYIIESITQVKGLEPQLRKAEQISITMIEMMEGEKEAPPILQREFANNPLAREGWEIMTASQKRGHLWGIAYYKSEASRDKRIQKAIAEMVAFAKRMSAT